VPTELVHKASNKIRSALNAVCFTPDGRRLLTGSNNGEITIWGSHLLNYETTFQAHDSAIRVMRWSHGRDWLISGDNNGDIKYWRRNLSELPSLKAHNSVSIRDLSFAPSDARFVSCGDDAVIKIWSFRTKQEESHLIGHGWDVRTVDWHPFKGIIASGGKDNTIILWDPRSGGRKLTSIHGHHNAIVSVRWNQNGNWFASASRDNLIRVFDIRMMAELQQMRGHQVELGAIVWHPHHESLLTSGSANGQIRHWIVGEENSVAVIDKAHDYAAWALDYHPDGHLLASGSNDTTARIWRPVRPGE
ncbi:WD40 repeat-like protein, partial [Ramicandelaber brevisporus]